VIFHADKLHQNLTGLVVSTFTVFFWRSENCTDLSVMLL